MFSALTSPLLRSRAAPIAVLLCCCWLELAQSFLAAATSTDDGNRTTLVPANSSATPPHVTAATNATGHSECPSLQEHSGGSGGEACQWSAAFYVIVVLAALVVILTVVIPIALLCCRRQRNSQGQENVEAKAADDKPQGRRKKNDYTGPPISPPRVQQDPMDIDYSLVPDNGDHIYGNEESVYVNTELDREPPAIAPDSSGSGSGTERRGGATTARGSSNDADEIDHLPQAPLPPAARDVSKNRLHRAEDGGRKAARVPEAGTAVAAVGCAPRQRAAGGSAKPSKSDVEAKSAESVPRKRTAGDIELSKPLKAEAAATAAAPTTITEKLARAVAAKRLEMEKQAQCQETEPVYENFRR